MDFTDTISALSPDISVSYTDTEDVHGDTFERRDNLVPNEPISDESAASNVAESTNTGTLRPRECLKPPVALQDYDTSYFTSLDSEEPTSLKEAKSSPNALKWKEAIKMEMKTLSDNQTWTFVDKSEEGLLIVDSKWVFRIKRNVNNEIIQ